MNQREKRRELKKKEKARYQEQKKLKKVTNIRTSEKLLVLLDPKNQKNLTNDQKMIVKAMAYALQRPCFLCGETSKVAALYQPSKNQLVRVRDSQGRVRVIPYGLCERCDSLPLREASQRIEEKMDLLLDMRSNTDEIYDLLR